jgi:hypothetical protein
MTPRRTEFTAFVLDLLAFHRREDRRGMENEPSRIGTSYSSRDNAPVRTAAASRYGWRYTPGGSPEGGSATNSGVIRGGQQQQQENQPFGLVSGRGRVVSEPRMTRQPLRLCICTTATSFAGPSSRRFRKLEIDWASRSCEQITSRLSASRSLPAPACGR